MVDNGKRYPILQIGKLPFSIPGALELPLSAIGASHSIPVNEFYVLLGASGGNIENATKLLKAGLPPDQLIVCSLSFTELPPQFRPWVGSLDLLENETIEEFRLRLLARLEIQRQKKLNYALQSASEHSPSNASDGIDLSIRIDGARITHSLACAYALSPHSHSLALKAAIENAPHGAEPWAAETTTEELILKCAFLLLDCQARGNSFKEQFKERSAALPFRARSELLHHIETGLGFLLGGKSHAA